MGHERDPMTGLTIWGQSKHFNRNYLNGDDTFNTAPYSDCDIFCTASIAAEFGMNPDYSRKVIIRQYWEMFGFRRVRGDSGESIFMTHTQSAAAAANSWHTARLLRRRERVPGWTGVSSASAPAYLPSGYFPSSYNATAVSSLGG
ncbi:MAG: hypothetical protein KIT79_08325 [Deltaproteobacteria bacterium]|nr:hypothetical protein [Deltaproteobacteria bacterium]